jgi:large subunit ribosomal protein L21
MILAVIKTGGKQYVVKPGQVLKVEKLDGEVGDKVSFDQVLLWMEAEGQVEVGFPTIAGKAVPAEIMVQGHERTVRVVKYKSKVRYHKVYGNRQRFTQVKILVEGEVSKKKAVKAEKTEKTVKPAAKKKTARKTTKKAE